MTARQSSATDKGEKMKRTPQQEAERRAKNEGVDAALEHSRQYLAWIAGIGALGGRYERQAEIVRALEAMAKQ